MTFRSVPTVLLLYAAVAAGLTAQIKPAAPGAGLTLLATEGRQTIPTTTSGGREMVALDDLTRIFKLTVREDTAAGGLTVSYKDKTVALTPNQSVASVGGRLVSLPAPVVREGNRWLVPVEFLERALARIYEPVLDVRLRSRLVVLGPLRVPRVVARQETLGGQSRVTLDVTPATDETIVQEQRRLVVRFDADWLDFALPQSTASGLVESVRLADPGTAIAIDLGAEFGSFRATTVPGDGSRRVVIDILAASPAPAPGTTEPASPLPPLAGFGGAPAVRAVVIDPGHGGEENGARGPAGTLEKQVTLGVARRLKALLEGGLGIRVLLTRESDRAVGADERAALANNNKADVFVSLHLNASLRAETSGVQVYFMDFVGLEQAVEDAERQVVSLPVLGGGSRVVDVIPWEMAQARHLDESAGLAALVQEELAARLQMNSHAVQQAPLRVLLGANMPAVLIEMGFVTNAEEEGLLKTPEYQGQLAQALYRAIVRFRDRDFVQTERLP